jgi:hypothetical protein
MRPIIIAAIVMLAVPAHGQQGSRETFTDQRGNFAGSATTRGNATSFTDRRGDFAGSAITRGNRTDYFDARGRYQGTATKPQR